MDSVADRPRLLLACALPEEALAPLQARFEVTVLPQPDRPDPERVLRALSAADVMVHSVTLQVTREMVEHMPAGVRAIGTYSVGLDHIDLAACARRGIAVINTPDVLTDAVAEVGMLLLLGAARRVRESTALLDSGSWKGWQPTQLNGSGLSGKVLGIIGMGRIGRAVALRARAFGMAIHYQNRTRLDPELEAGATYHGTLASLLATCDALLLACPATEETRGLLGWRSLATMKPGAIVVNIGRGALVDDEALIDALKTGRVRAAGLDVFNGEPEIDPRYRTLPNVFALPHIGSSTIETRVAMARCLAEALAALLRGHDAANRIA